MADAIPVHSEPKRKVAVQPATDGNGVPVPADYATVVRENLGDPADFKDDAEGKTTEVVSTMEVPQVVDGKTVTVLHTHRAIRVDH